MEYTEYIKHRYVQNILKIMKYTNKKKGEYIESTQKYNMYNIYKYKYTKCIYKKKCT